MPKALCILGTAISVLLLVLFGLDLATSFPFGREAVAMDVGGLRAAAILGYLLLSPVAEIPLAIIQAFAAGAVVSSLATEVFPKAYKQDQELTGIAVARGGILAFALHQIG